MGTLLINSGADISATDKFGATPLHGAAMSNDLEMAKALVKKGANLSAKTQDGQTPLDFAKKKNSTEVAAYLGSLAK